jgi:hypothetical protein
LRGFLDSFLFDLNGFLEVDFEELLLGRMLWTLLSDFLLPKRDRERVDFLELPLERMFWTLLSDFLLPPKRDRERVLDFEELLSIV